MVRSAKIPDFFIVGAPKSGTTAMAHYLREHPEIFMPLRKEVHFFGSDLTRVPHEFFVLERDLYLALFARAGEESRLGEASVMYLLSRRAAEEIKRFNPESRIIIMLRNPVDMLYSYHSQLVWGVYEDILDFEQALTAEADRRKGKRIGSHTMMPQALLYREVARYSEQVERYLRVFDRGRVHVEIFDDFVRDNAAAYRRVLEFLEVDPGFQPEFTVVNRNKNLRVRAFQRMVQRPPLPLALALKLLPDDLRIWSLGKLQRLNTRYVRRTPLDPALRERLCREFRPDVERLGALLDRDLSSWCSG